MVDVASFIYHQREGVKGNEQDQVNAEAEGNG